MKIIKTYESYNNFDDLDLGRFSYLMDRTLLIQNTDGTFDYKGNLDFSENELESLLEIPIRFKNVSGSFNCSKNYLSSLEGSPESVGKSFHCTENTIISLKGSPKYIGFSFYCTDNQLISLQYAPLEVGKNFFCYEERLLSYVHMSKIGDAFYYEPNPLIITDKIIDTVKKMTIDQQMSELNFFGKYDKDAYKMMMEILEGLGVSEEIKHRKEMLDRVKGNDNLKALGL